MNTLARVIENPEPAANECEFWGYKVILEKIEYVRSKISELAELNTSIQETLRELRITEDSPKNEVLTTLRNLSTEQVATMNAIHALRMIEDYRKLSLKIQTLFQRVISEWQDEISSLTINPTIQWIGNQATIRNKLRLLELEREKYKDILAA